MTLTQFVTKNAFRNKRRTILTVISISVSLLLLTLMMTVWRAFYIDKGAPEASLRLITRHKVSLTNMMPLAYEAKIRQVPGVVAVGSMNWFGGKYKDDKPENFFAQFAVEPESIVKAYPENHVPEEQLQAWIRDRAGCMVDTQLAKKHGWNLGDRVVLKGSIFPVNLELTVRAIYTAEVPSDTLFFNAKYLEEAVSWFGGQTGFYAVMVDAPQNMTQVAQAIDAAFHNSPQPTKSESEKAFVLDFIATLGNVKGFILGISGAVCFAILLVSANTMAMSVRERTREVAVLKALGFTRRLLLVLFVGESVAIALAGGVLGSLAGAAVVKILAGVPQMQGLLNGVTVTWQTLGVAWLIAALVGLLSGLFPSYHAASTEIVQGLRHTG